MIPARKLALLVTIVALAVTVPRIMTSRGSPFAEAPAIDRVAVVMLEDRYVAPPPAALTRAQGDSLGALLRSGGWKAIEPSFPTGDVMALLYGSTGLIGTLYVSQGAVVAVRTRAEDAPRVKRLTPSEQAFVAAVLK